MDNLHNFLITYMRTLYNDFYEDVGGTLYIDLSSSGKNICLHYVHKEKLLRFILEGEAYQYDSKLQKFLFNDTEISSVKFNKDLLSMFKVVGAESLQGFKILIRHNFRISPEEINFPDSCLTGKSPYL